jgi:rare lipoprotein A
MGKHRVLAAATAALACLAAGAAGPVAAEEQRNPREERARPGEDTSGRVQRGEASYYHPKLEGRPMANGERFDAQSDSAASRTLPLGTTARVTNTETGRSTTVEVEDRGPYARGRILDVSPRTAEELGMKRDGTARVEIAPIEVPQRDGGTRPGAGAGGGDAAARPDARGADGGGPGEGRGR